MENSYRRQMNTYRIYPVLWSGSSCQQAQTVYAVDRQPPLPGFPTACSSRPKEDPASTWDSSTFQRLLPPAGSSCYQPASLAAVTWSTLPAWLSYAQGIGYTLASDLSKLKPYSDLYITGP